MWEKRNASSFLLAAQRFVHDSNVLWIKLTGGRKIE